MKKSANRPVSSISCLMSVSSNLKLKPRYSNMVKSDMVSSSTSWLGHTALMAAARDMSFVRS
jgi:hypothetical protein